MVKYQVDFEHQMQIIEELKYISPIKRNKRTGWLNESTIEYFNLIMGSIYDGGLMDNKITIK